MATPLSDLFAPAYRRSDPNSVAAVQGFMDRKYPITGLDLDSTRMPTAGITGGVVDPAAMRAVAQGGAYDIGARRDAIASTVQQQQAAAAAAQQKAQDPWTQYMQQYGGGLGSKTETYYDAGGSFNNAGG